MVNEITGVKVTNDYDEFSNLVGPIETVVNLISYIVVSMMSAIYMKQKIKKILSMALEVDY
jgi:hypothetical protein